MMPPQAREREQGITVFAKVTAKGIILVDTSFTAFSSHEDLLGGREVEKPLPPGSTLQLSSGEEALQTQAVSHIRLQIIGTVIRVLGVKQDGKEVDLPAYQREPDTGQRTIERNAREFSLPAPVSLTMGSAGQLELDDDCTKLFQQQGIMSALFSGDPVFIAVPENSKIQTAPDEDSTDFTKCTLQREGPSIVVLSVAKGERSIFQKTDAKTGSERGPTAPPLSAQVKIHPLIQVLAEVEKELRALLIRLAVHIERERARKASEHDDARTQKAEHAALWPTQLLKAIARKAREFEDARHKANFILPVPQVTKSVGVMGNLFGREIIETEINPEQPTFVASALLEILQTGTVCGQRVPSQLRDAVRKFIQTIAQRKQIGDGPYAVRPGRQVSLFGKFAEGRYEFGGVQDEEQLGFTDRQKTWKQLQALLASDTAPRIAQVSAFKQVTLRMVPESTSTRAPGYDAGEEARKDYDRTLLATVQSARNSQFYQALPAEAKRAFDEQCATVTGNVAKRGLMTVDDQWMSTEAARMRSAGRAVKGNL